VKQVAERLRGAGLRVTAPRVAILCALEKDRTHPTAEQLFESLREGHPSLSLSTVYNTLEIFLQQGLCRRVNSDGSLRVDGTLRPHDHAVCRSCGTIFDIDRKHFAVPSLPARLPHGLRVTGFHVEYDVVCTGCRNGGGDA
jgi:Fur family transcriptional regulator, peroxide stress response regulator